MNERKGIIQTIEMYNKKCDQTTNVEHLNTFNDLYDIANIIVVYMKNEKIETPAFKIFEYLKKLHAYQYCYEFNLRCIKKYNNQNCIKKFKEYYNKYLVIHNAVKNQLPKCAEFRSLFVNPKTSKIHSHDSSNLIKYMRIIKQPIDEMLKEQCVKDYYKLIVDIKENVENIKDLIRTIKVRHLAGEFQQ